MQIPAVVMVRNTDRISGHVVAVEEYKSCSRM